MYETRSWVVMRSLRLLPERHADADISRIFARRAELLRQLADLDVELGRAVSEALPRSPADEALGLALAAAFMGEPPETFRRRLDYRKALISKPGERRLRYSRAVLDRIKRDRLAAHGGS
jgi:hypothetical protein